MIIQARWRCYLSWGSWVRSHGRRKKPPIGAPSGFRNSMPRMYLWRVRLHYALHAPCLAQRSDGTRGREELVVYLKECSDNHTTNINLTPLLLRDYRHRWMTIAIVQLPSNWACLRPPTRSATPTERKAEQSMLSDGPSHDATRDLLSHPANSGILAGQLPTKLRNQIYPRVAKPQLQSVADCFGFRGRL